MNDKERRNEKWLEKYRLFRREAVQELTCLYKEAVQPRRASSAVRWHQFRTQKIRREIARLLGDLLDLAATFAKDDGLSLKEREKWTRLAAYIGQTLNTILNSHDTVSIEVTLDKLNRYVEKHVG